MSDEGETTERIVAALAAGGRVAWRAGRWTVSGVGTGVSLAVRQALAPQVARIVRAENPPRDVRAALERARRGSDVGQATSWVAPRAIKRLRPAASLSRRTPLGLTLWLGPSLTQTVAQSVRELSVVAAELAGRARAASVEPSPTLVQEAAVRVVAGRETGDPHLALARRWLRGVAGGMVPFGSRGAPDVDDLVDAIDAVDPADLG